MPTPLRLAATAAASVLTLALAGCGGAARQSGITTSPAAASTTPSSATDTASSTTTPPATTAATVPPNAPRPTVAVTYPESQQEYTSQLVRAWGVGDRVTAARYATDAAVRRLFGTIDSGGPHWSLLGCDNAGPRPACTFADPGQGQRLVLFYDSARLALPRAVVDAQFLSDNPASATQ